MYVLTERLLSFNWQRFTLHKNEKRNLELYRKIPSSTNLLNCPRIFHISAQNIDCGYSLEPPWRGGSNEYPQSLFLSRNKRNNVYPCKPQFYYIKVGLRGSKLYRHVFVMRNRQELNFTSSGIRWVIHSFSDSLKAKQTLWHIIS